MQTVNCHLIIIYNSLFAIILNTATIAAALASLHSQLLVASLELGGTERNGTERNGSEKRNIHCARVCACAV